MKNLTNMISGALRRIDAFCENRPDLVKAWVLGLFAAGSLFYLAPSLFTMNTVYQDDSTAFLRMTNAIVDYFRGERTWLSIAVDTGERTLLQPFLMACIAWIFNTFDPHFMVLSFWLLFVAPIPFIIFVLVKETRASWVALLTPLVMLSDPTLANLAVASVFTDVPPIMFALLGFALILKGRRLYALNGSRRWLLAAGVAFACAIATRWHTTIPVLIPGLIALFIAHVWPLKKKDFACILWAVLGCVLSFASLFYLLDFSYALDHGVTLITHHKESPWAYGGGGAERNVDNIFMHRLKNNLIRAVFDYSTANILILISLLALARRSYIYVATLALFAFYASGLLAFAVVRCTPTRSAAARAVVSATKSSISRC